MLLPQGLVLIPALSAFNDELGYGTMREIHSSSSCFRSWHLVPVIIQPQIRLHFRVHVGEPLVTPRVTNMHACVVTSMCDSTKTLVRMRGSPSMPSASSACDVVTQTFCAHVQGVGLLSSACNIVTSSPLCACARWPLKAGCAIFALSLTTIPRPVCTLSSNKLLSASFRISCFLLTRVRPFQSQ